MSIVRTMMPRHLFLCPQNGRRRRQRPAACSSLWFQKIVAALFLFLLLSLLLRTATAEGHSSNHAVIVSSSRYWFNYRHVVNALSIYDLLRTNNIPDENIILMLADDIPGNPRNVARNGMYSKGISSSTSLYNATTQIDYRGDDVTVDNLVKVLLGTTRDEEPSLHSDESSHVLVYLTGHGGDSFFKFQDVEEIMSSDLNRIFTKMHELGRYKELLLIADTCQAFTLLPESLTAPNVFFLGSSLKNENSYAHHADSQLGLSVIERYTHAVVEFIERNDNGGVNDGASSSLTLKQALVDHLSYQEQRAHIGYRDETCERKMKDVPLRDFFEARSKKKAAPANVHFWTTEDIAAASSEAETWEFINRLNRKADQGAS